jgi:predicted porin
MIKQILAISSIVLFSSAIFAAEIIPYGSFNYKWSNDENSSGKSYSKLEDNGSSIGVEVIDLGVEGDTITGFAKLEVGVDTDDSGSDTFDSKLAYVGLDSDMGSLSVGRQSHPFTDNIGGKTSIFNVYGGGSDWNYGSRSSNSMKFSTTQSGLTLDTIGIVDGSSTNTNAFDEFEVTISTKLLGSDISVGYADDVNSDISYWGVSGSTDLGPLTVSSSYTIYDAATDKYGLEATASYSIFSVGYGDKEGTGVSYTAGVSHDLNKSVSVYAEGEMKDLDSGSDTTSWSIGSKFTF